MTDMYRGSGTEPLRSDPNPKSGSVTPSPSGAGKDAGGTANLRADGSVKQAGVKQTPSGGATKIRGVQSFTDDKV